METATTEAEEITRKSGSNLALAFLSLGRERRADISLFYAFCRLIDDIADSTELSVAEKRHGLATWRRSLSGPIAEEPALAPALRDLQTKYPISPGMLSEIIDGVEMDLSITSYATFAELRVYCYRVASAVGLVSIEIFGYKNPRCRKYAIELGLALQMTNILRDVGKDLRFGRIYLPAEDLRRFGYAEEELRAEKYDERFRALMEFEAARAREYFGRAKEILPREDRRSMVAAEIMSSIYAALLRKIERDGFRVFTRDYRLSKTEKMVRIAAGLLKIV